MSLTRRGVLEGAVALGAGIVLRSAGAGAQPVSPPTGLIERKIPSSGEAVPVIGIGTARRWEAVATDADRTVLRDVLRRFADLGGKVVDTAPSYGSAERVVGDLVASLNVRARLFLATKVGANGRQAGVAQIEQSFARLSAKVIDLVAVHNLTDVTSQLETLGELKQAGRIRYLGITTSFPRQYAAFEQTMRTERLDFIQVDYALDHREAARTILPLAAERGIAVMVNLPFGRGRLFKAVQGRDLPAWVADFDCPSWAVFFLKYIVSHPAVTCCIPGIAKVEHLVDNIRAARGQLPAAATRRRMEAFIDAL